MAQPKRDDTAFSPAPILPSSTGYRLGGPVGQMQADLAHRLMRESAALPDERAGEGSGEQAVRFVSAASGYLALLAAYAGLAGVLLR